MPGFLLDESSTATCSHGGLARPTAPNPRVRIMGQPTVSLGAPYVVAGCALPPPPISDGPCLSAQFVAGAARLTSMGRPLLLQSSPAICAPTGAPLLIVATQTRVSGI